MTSSIDLLLFLLSAALSYLIIKITIPFCPKALLDIPNHRSSHEMPLPKAGGIYFLFIPFIFSLFIDNSFLFLSIPIAILGLLDDIFNLRPLIRYSFQVLFSILIVKQSINLYIDFSSPLLYYLLFSFLVFISTAFINFSNFMDGIDGLLAGCFIIALFSVSISLEIVLAPLLGSLLAFLIFNWHPARIFMGDTGSTFLGFIYFYTLLLLGDASSFIAFTLILTPIFADASICVIRRLLSNQSIFRPHRLHLYQRLLAVGWSQSLISSIYIIATILLSLSYLVGDLHFLILTVIITIAFGFYLDMKFSLRFLNALDE